MIEEHYVSMLAYNEWESSFFNCGVVTVKVSQSLGIWPKYSSLLGHSTNVQSSKFHAPNVQFLGMTGV